jgi:NAD(P)-dependent dehydrogenase (short-subunit alcohol dehydrogenase family)
MTGAVAPVKGFPVFGVYSASKAALRSFAHTWLIELKGRNTAVLLLRNELRLTLMNVLHKLSLVCRS